MLYAADAEHLGGRVRFAPPPLGVLVFRGPLRWSLDAARTVTHERTHNPGAARRQLDDQAAAAQYLVVVVRRQHQHAASRQRLRRARRQRPLGTRHGANPPASSGGSRTERTGRWRFSFTALLNRRACYRSPTAGMASETRSCSTSLVLRGHRGSGWGRGGGMEHLTSSSWRHPAVDRPACSTGPAPADRPRRRTPVRRRYD